MDDTTAPLSAARHSRARVSRGAFSAAGPQRAHNEDAFSLPPAGAEEARWGTLCALADGVGSRPGGAAASRQAVHLLQALYYSPAGHPQPGERLRECVETVNLLSRNVLRVPGPTASLPLAEPLTTLVAAVVFNQRLWVANVGDSRAYLVRASGECRRLTEDHSEILGPGQATRAITRAIGLEEQSQVDIYSYTWKPGDRLVLCSDGLSGLHPADMVPAVLKAGPAAAARQLVNEAVRRDGSDNATVVVMSWEPRPTAGVRPARHLRAEPAWASLGLVAGVGVLTGLALGWASALVMYLSMSGRGIGW